MKYFNPAKVADLKWWHAQSSETLRAIKRHSTRKADRMMAYGILVNRRTAK